MLQGVTNRWRITVVVLCAAMLAPVARGDGASVNVLLYGNSFTFFNATVPAVVRTLGQDNEQPVNAVSATIGGAGLAEHWLNNRAVIGTALPPGQRWDWVVLQDYSTMPTRLGAPVFTRRYAVLLHRLVRDHSPGARAVLFETWARAPGHAFYAGSAPAFPGGPSQMQAEVRAGYALTFADIAHHNGAGSVWLARVGSAFEGANWTGLYASDQWHPSPRGTVLAGIMIYSAITGIPASTLNLAGVAALSGVPPAECLQIAVLADAHGGQPVSAPDGWAPVSLTDALPPPPQPPPPSPPPPTPGPAPYCPAADFNRDGNLDPDDLADFITAFFSSEGDPLADFNRDGMIDPDDMADFITTFFAGC